VGFTVKLEMLSHSTAANFPDMTTEEVDDDGRAEEEDYEGWNEDGF
jgi:hypothetical protein